VGRLIPALALSFLLCTGCYGGEDDLPEVSPPPPAQVVLEKTLTLQGSGRSTESITLEPGGPIVFAARAQGEEKFFVKIVMSPGPQEIVLFDQEGPVDSRSALWPGAVPARTTAKLEVRAAGPWALVVDRPEPIPDPASLPGVVEGRGFDVIPVWIEERGLDRLSVRHEAKGFIYVELLTYEDLAPGIPLFDERGPIERRLEIEPPEPGPYLLHVRARGPWRVSFGA
jgi:hypothetical protein